MLYTGECPPPNRIDDALTKVEIGAVGVKAFTEVYSVPEAIKERRRVAANFMVAQ